MTGPDRMPCIEDGCTRKGYRRNNYLCDSCHDQAVILERQIGTKRKRRGEQTALAAPVYTGVLEGGLVHVHKTRAKGSSSSSLSLERHKPVVVKTGSGSEAMNPDPPTTTEPSHQQPAPPFSTTGSGSGSGSGTGTGTGTASAELESVISEEASEMVMVDSTKEAELLRAAIAKRVSAGDGWVPSEGLYMSSQPQARSKAEEGGRGRKHVPKERADRDLGSTMPGEEKEKKHGALTGELRTVSHRSTRTRGKPPPVYDAAGASAPDYGGRPVQHAVVSYEYDKEEGALGVIHPHPARSSFNSSYSGYGSGSGSPTGRASHRSFRGNKVTVGVKFNPQSQYQPSYDPTASPDYSLGLLGQLTVVCQANQCVREATMSYFCPNHHLEIYGSDSEVPSMPPHIPLEKVITRTNTTAAAYVVHPTFLSS